ncbi:MAG: phosphoribosyltransferase, partial [Pseudomonadota bacterium]
MAEFRNREHAGELLAQGLKPYAAANTIVYALPRGGVPVAAPIAQALKAPLSLLFVQRMGAPEH